MGLPAVSSHLAPVTGWHLAPPPLVPEVRRPCLRCGGLTIGASYCAGCKRDRNRDRNTSRPWYDDAWRRFSRALRSDPSAVCEVCGTREDLTVDHVTPRSASGGYRVLCRKHNAQKGGAA